MTRDVITKKRSRDDAMELKTVAAARQLWLSATTEDALVAVEAFYKSEMARLKALRMGSGTSTISEDEVEVREKLILLLLQSGRPEAAKIGLESLGYVARLASCVLNYKIPSLPSNDTLVSQVVPPCIVRDGALDDSTLMQLRRALQDPGASYWSTHDYSVEPPSPYYSYVIPLTVLDQPDGFGALGAAIRVVKDLGRERFGDAAMEEIRFAELWAHNRPHASGHQLHYDSDDEGRGGLRHPTVTSVTFVDGDVGGPTLMTNQRLGDPRLGTQGWLCPSKSNRVLVFDGRYLHGVIPGKGISPLPQGRRVTMMLALWRNIEVRDEPGAGSARPFPLGDAQPEWAKALSRGSNVSGTRTSHHPAPIEPIPLPALWEKVNGETWPPRAPIPPYEAVYQGF